MRHRKSGRKLGRKTGPRRALMRSLVRNLFLMTPKEDAGHLERVITTPAKAKEARKLAERIITLGKRGDLAARRRAMVLLGDRPAVAKVFKEIAPRYADRPGGYTRILHWHTPRLGDDAPQVLFELVEAEMQPKEEKKPAAPKAASQSPAAPAVTEPEAGQDEDVQAEEAPQETGGEADETAGDAEDKAQ